MNIGRKRRKCVDRERVMADYNLLKRLARLSLFFGIYSWAVDIISNAASLMYHFNLFYCDPEFELMLKKISEKIVRNKNRTYGNDKGKVVFYDYFSLDNRGLTEQYLDGLIANGYEILYIALQQKTEQMRNILIKLNSYCKAQICFIRRKNNTARCNEIAAKILEFGPSKILFHSAPWDAVGCVVLSAFDGSRIERFLINLTDHAFWLGRGCCDYFLEFRSYGVNISVDYRYIESNKLLIIPYYPIQNASLEFQGFPFDAAGKKVIVSGGSLYKIYGSTVFFDIVKRILNLHSDTIFFYLGNGNAGPLLDFIKANHFENRFFYSQERKDINEIISRCYFYLGTYPLAGGLMSQLAAANNKIPVAFTEEKYKMNNIDELFINNDREEFTFYTLNDIYSETDKLINDNEYYSKKTESLKNKVISRNDFSNLLYSVMENKKSPYSCKKYDIDIQSFSQIYIDQENNYLYNYENYFFTIKNILVFFLFFRYVMQKIVKKIFIPNQVKQKNRGL